MHTQPAARQASSWRPAASVTLPAQSPVTSPPRLQHPGQRQHPTIVGSIDFCPPHPFPLALCRSFSLVTLPPPLVSCLPLQHLLQCVPTHLQSAPFLSLSPSLSLSLFLSFSLSLFLSFSHSHSHSLSLSHSLSRSLALSLTHSLSLSLSRLLPRSL